MITKNIKEKIKEYFFLYPSSKLRVRQIERTLNLSLPSVIRYCKELEREGILRSVNVGGVRFYTASRNEKFFIEKRIFNIKKVFESGLINYLKINLHNPNIILFGSYSRGEDLEDGDIDLYIETRSTKKINLKVYEKKLRRKIHVFIYKNIEEVKNKNLANNIINGIVLNGFVEVFK